METERDIEKIIEQVRKMFSDVRVEQLRVSNPADDDGIWYFWLPTNDSDDIQIENSHGNCPFLIETMRNSERRHGETIEETAKIICDHLMASRPSIE